MRDLIRIERGLGQIGYLINRVKRHEWIRSSSGIPIDRAAAVVLRRLVEFAPIRPGELAGLLEVEAPHVTRQVRRLEDLGYVEQISDVNDRRAQLITLTPSGRAAARRIRDASRDALAKALTDWEPGELHELADLFTRMVDDYLAYSEQK
jgi:DNA-binding MarR family transcriptional regulator